SLASALILSSFVILGLDPRIHKTRYALAAFGISDTGILINEFAKAAKARHLLIREQYRRQADQTGRLS
ncbi:hypothetical protein KYK30_09150, partial [Shinella yambaruensis]|uniref:hypothetical protein n=1 Tax=Shinella yambaruensis TaxID=415996 RepID=UPI0021D9728A